MWSAAANAPEESGRLLLCAPGWAPRRQRGHAGPPQQQQHQQHQATTPPLRSGRPELPDAGAALIAFATAESRRKCERFFGAELARRCPTLGGGGRATKLQRLLGLPPGLALLAAEEREEALLAGRGVVRVLPGDEGGAAAGRALERAESSATLVAAPRHEDEALAAPGPLGEMEPLDQTHLPSDLAALGDWRSL
jgi:hypothetical protein